MLPAKPRWSYHSNQLFYSSLILCSFCWSRRHDYSIGQSLSAWGAWPMSGRSPGWLLCISHAQLVRRMAGRTRGRGEQPPTQSSALTEAACTSHATSLPSYTLQRQPLARSLHKVRNSSVVKQCTDCCPKSLWFVQRQCTDLGVKSLCFIGKQSADCSSNSQWETAALDRFDLSIDKAQIAELHHFVFSINNVQNCQLN